jgi:Flp pilus assembly protein TadG
VRRARSGTAALEFAFGAPLLVILLVGVVELGFSIYQAMQVQSAADAGAVYVAKHGWNSAAISAAVTGATAASGLTASPAPTQFCGCPSASGIAVATCGSLCASGAVAGGYVQINATLSHQTILSYPGITPPATFSAQTVVRVN